MARQSGQKRGKLIDAADNLVSQQGFHETTLADIAVHAGIPLGNVYYYFKTKEELGSAIIERRVKYYRELILEWEKPRDPKTRIAAFISYVEGRSEYLSHKGCPIGSLCQELNKRGSAPLAEQATALFTALLDWLRNQFLALGCEAASADHALHLVSALQGAALLTHTFGDPELTRRETARLKEWIASLQP